MMVDLSHVAATTMRDALGTTDAPVVFSHSSALALCDTPRNVPDDVLAALPANRRLHGDLRARFVSPATAAWRVEAAARGGRGSGRRQGLGGVRALLRDVAARAPEPDATIEQVVAHVEHVREVAASTTSASAATTTAPTPPRRARGRHGYPRLVAALLERSWSEADVAQLVRGNTLRVMRDGRWPSPATCRRPGPRASRRSPPSTGAALTALTRPR